MLRRAGGLVLQLRKAAGRFACRALRLLSGKSLQSASAALSEGTARARHALDAAPEAQRLRSDNGFLSPRDAGPYADEPAVYDGLRALRLQQRLRLVHHVDRRGGAAAADRPRDRAPLARRKAAALHPQPRRRDRLLFLHGLHALPVLRALSALPPRLRYEAPAGAPVEEARSLCARLAPCGRRLGGCASARLSRAERRRAGHALSVHRALYLSGRAAHPRRAAGMRREQGRARAADAPDRRRALCACDRRGLASLEKEGEKSGALRALRLPYAFCALVSARRAARRRLPRPVGKASASEAAARRRALLGILQRQPESLRGLARAAAGSELLLQSRRSKARARGGAAASACAFRLRLLLSAEPHLARL